MSPHFPHRIRGSWTQAGDGHWGCGTIMKYMEAMSTAPVQVGSACGCLGIWSHLGAVKKTDLMLYSGLKSGAFGAVALFGVIFYASGIPRLQKDVLQV